MNQDLDHWCEELIKEEFGEECDFDVDDAVGKLEKLGIVSRVRFPKILLLPNKQNNIIFCEGFDLFVDW